MHNFSSTKYGSMTLWLDEKFFFTEDSLEPNLAIFRKQKYCRSCATDYLLRHGFGAFDILSHLELIVLRS